jgi:hypothetical protein
MSNLQEPGYYALLHANGATWVEIVEEIRNEAIADYRQVPRTLPQGEETS